MGLRLAVSKSGHDKGSIYVILREEAGVVYLADGKRRTTKTPKKKNKKHVQAITHIPEEVAGVFGKGEFEDGNFRDTEIQRAIKLYRAKISGDGEGQGLDCGRIENVESGCN